jgi:hypothetical protein
MIVIIVERVPRRDGWASGDRYAACLEGEARPLVISRAPFLAAARVLRDRGVNPDTRLVMRWRGSTVDSLSAQLGVAAALAVNEGPPMRFVRYAQLPKQLLPEN